MTLRIATDERETPIAGAEGVRDDRSVKPAVDPRLEDEPVLVASKRVRNTRRFGRVREINRSRRKRRAFECEILGVEERRGMTARRQCLCLVAMATRSRGRSDIRSRFRLRRICDPVFGRANVMGCRHVAGLDRRSGVEPIPFEVPARR